MRWRWAAGRVQQWTSSYLLQRGLLQRDALKWSGGVGARVAASKQASKQAFAPGVSVSVSERQVRAVVRADAVRSCRKAIKLATYQATLSSVCRRQCVTRVRYIALES